MFYYLNIWVVEFYTIECLDVGEFLWIFEHKIVWLFECLTNLLFVFWIFECLNTWQFEFLNALSFKFECFKVWILEL